MRLRRPNIAKLREQRDEEGLIAALEDEDPAIREAAANALERVAGPEAVEPLSAALEDQSPSVRLAVVNTLAHLEATDPLIHALDDEEDRVRESAAKSLAKVAVAAKAVEQLIGMLQDVEPEVRRRVLEQLRQLGAPDEPLGINLLENESAPPDVREWAAYWLRPGRTGIDALIRVLEDEDEYEGVVGAAEEGLKGVLAKTDDPHARALAEAALDERRDRDATMQAQEDVETLEHSEDEIERISAAERLTERAKGGAVDVVEPLIRALEDEEGGVRKVALQGLRESEDPRAVEAVKHDPAVGDRYKHEWVHVGVDYDTTDHWAGRLIEVSPPTEHSCEARVRVEEATGSFAHLEEGSVQTVDLGEFPNSANDHPSHREVENRSYTRLDPSIFDPHYTYCSSQ